MLQLKAYLLREWEVSRVEQLHVAIEHFDKKEKLFVPIWKYFNRKFFPGLALAEARVSQK